MEFSVELALHTRRPLTEDELFDVAGIGGAASGSVGGTRIETTLTVTAEDAPQAAARALARITEIVAGSMIAVNVMTIEEADRRLAEPMTEFVGLTEIAARLKVSKQRALQLSKRADFPAPYQRLASGAIWRKGDLTTFAAGGWQQKRGPKPGKK